MPITVKRNHSLHRVSDIAVKQDRTLYSCYKAIIKVGGTLYVVWQKVKSTITGGLFVQNHRTTVQGYNITFNFNSNGNN